MTRRAAGSIGPGSSGRLALAAAAAAAAVLGLGFGGVAQAAELRVFRLAPEAVDRAVVQFAQQGRVSVGGYPAPGCTGRSRVTVGLMSPAEALRRLLPAGCAFQTLDAHTFRIIAGAPSSRAPQSPSDIVTPGVAPAAVDELVVTAEKRVEPLVGSAFAVSVLSGDEIRRLGGRSFSDAALQVAGVTVTNLGSGRNKIFVRGLSDGSFTGKTQSTVGLYLDDVPITYSAPDPDLRLADVEQVEVLRGPQGTLYGSGSIGGIVRIITAKPDPGGLAGAITADLAGTQNGAMSSGVEAMLNVPLGHGGAVRLVGYRDRRGGYIDNVRLGLGDVNHGERSGWRVAGVAALPADWILSASYAHQSINTRDAQYAQGSVGPLARDAAVREPHDNDFSAVSASLGRNGGLADVKISAAFIDHAPDTRYDATGALGTVGPTAFDESRVIDLWVAEAVLTSAAGGRTRWLAGLFASRADETDDGALSGFSGMGPMLSVYRRKDKLTEAAVYGEFSYDLTSKVTATAGGRVFSTHQTTRMDGFGLARPSLGSVAGELDGHGFAPKLRLSFAPTPDRVIYAQVQEGYRTGGFNLPLQADGVTTAATRLSQFRPDRLRSFELGAEGPLLNRTLILRVALFHAQWRALQTDQYLASGLPMAVNIGDGANTGLELEGTWQPDDHLQLRLNLLVNDPEITRPSNTYPATADIGLPGVARMMGSADIRYRWELGSGVQATLSAQAGYVGHSYLTFEGGADNRMGGYGIGRLSGELEGARWRIEAYVENLTNETGDTFSFGDPFSRARAGQITPLRPRTAGVALTRRF
jgi:iron complex outermembrane receptor protein